MEECMQVLTEKQESPLDRNLVLLVRMQLITDDAIRSYGTTTDSSENVRMIHNMHIKALHARLQEVKAQIPPDLMSECEPSDCGPVFSSV
jgi:hypothetical protein